MQLHIQAPARKGEGHAGYLWLYGDPEYQNSARIQRQQSGKPGKTCRQQRTGYIKAMQGMFHCNQHLRSPLPRDTASVCCAESFLLAWCYTSGGLYNKGACCQAGESPAITIVMMTAWAGQTSDLTSSQRPRKYGRATLPTWTEEVCLKLK
ncbi:hypothetical protein TEQG_03643 [Trichophyton equinum CBS 127.97]|uniref:Uncharacterized protein n=1 Tax=Trichophyton equinum (strain ATCC MYA-4606 / CBS 127.97) TaxID=559882 RepID=F2PRC4_TRIEC|nr:hypothetical protein TEQG_03643 [Trichophyton equinum CBS 127.97]